MENHCANTSTNTPFTMELALTKFSVFGLAQGLITVMREGRSKVYFGFDESSNNQVLEIRPSLVLLIIHNVMLAYNKWIYNAKVMAILG